MSQDPPSAKDLELGLQFIHTMEMQTKSDVHETSATLWALLEELVSRGIVDLRTFEERRQRTRGRESERAMSLSHVTIDPTPDKYQLPALPQIDCEARIPLCKGRCCSFTFPLSRQDLDEHVVQWDYARPYQIRRREDTGYCVHNDATTRGCGVYHNRPSICRTYDCRTDKRIWKDFENRIPADAAEPPPTPEP